MTSVIFQSLIEFSNFDTNSITKRFELPSSVRPLYTYLPQTLASDSISNVSLQTKPSVCNELVNTHSIGNPPPNLDPHPLPRSNSFPPSKNPITTEPSTSYSPLQYNTP